MQRHLLHEQKTNYIIDTDIGGDIDDALALLVAMNSDSKPIAITTTHIEPEEKAKIAKLIVSHCGHEEIPVYAGIGCKRTDPKAEFVTQNPLFPAMFGYPNPDKEEKSWYPKQASAYKKAYGSKFDEMKVETESAADCIINIAKKYSPDNKLTIVALGPLHNLDASLRKDPSIAKNIKLFAMGGIYPKGYNWLISPATTARVISQVETHVITSEFIVNHKLCITQEELNALISQIQSMFGETFLEDWKNWHKGDLFNKKDTNLYDPVTLYLALHPHFITSSIGKQIAFPCLDQNGELRQSDFRDSWYFKPGLDHKIISSQDNPESNVRFVTQLTSATAIKEDIISLISSTLTKESEVKSELPKEKQPGQRTVSTSDMSVFSGKVSIPGTPNTTPSVQQTSPKNCLSH